jgi:hypothetical protein
LRFARAAAAYLTACPTCGAPPQPITSAQHVLGYRLHTGIDGADSLPMAAAAALAIPHPADRL